MLRLRLGAHCGAAVALGVAARPAVLVLMFLFSLGAGSRFQRPLGLGDALQALLAPPQFGRQFVAAPLAAVAFVFLGVGLFGLSQQLLDLLAQTLFFTQHALVAHGLMLTGVRLDLRSIDGHPAKLQR